MKKAKIILPVIAVFASVGAVFAFRMHGEMKTEGVTYFTCNNCDDPANGECVQVTVAGRNLNTTHGSFKVNCATIQPVVATLIDCNDKNCTNSIFYDTTILE